MSQIPVTERVEPERAIRLVDCDIHTNILPSALHARLSSPWQRHLEDFGPRVATALAVYPRMRGGGSRLDARPGERARRLGPGAAAGAAAGRVRHRSRDHQPDAAADVRHGGARVRRGLCRAFNDWTREEWLDQDARLLGSICPPHEHPELAVLEIERLADDERFVQVLLPTRLEQQLGNQRYWPILRAATEAGLPVAMHTGGLESYRGSGWPSYYLDMHVLISTTMAQQFLSMICSGVFEEIPALRMVAVETGIGWAAALSWAMDDAWRAFGETVTTRLRKPPSEYLREHFWFTTQPIEEPRDPDHLAVAFDALGMTDRIMFSTDYPHWDFDAPGQALPPSISKDDKARIFAANAVKLYELPRR